MRTFALIVLGGWLACVLAVSPALAAKVPFDITLVSHAGDPLRTLADAQQLLNHPSAPAIILENQSYELRFSGDGNRHTGPFGMNYYWPSAHRFDVNNFALETSAWLAVPTAGTWTFAVTSDDGFSMTVNGKTFQHTSRRATRTTLETVDFAAAGDYQMALTYFQHLGPSELEVSDAPGTHTHMGPRQGFHLLNANAFESLQVVDPPPALSASDPPPNVGDAAPEPGSLSLLGMTMAVVLMRRKRSAVLHS